jgi:hypothetical protein
MNITDTERAVIEKLQTNHKGSAIVANTIGRIGDMPTVLHQEVVSLNKQAGEIKLQAKEINDGNLPNKEELLKDDRRL